MLYAYRWEHDRLVRLDEAAPLSEALWIDLLTPSLAEEHRVESLVDLDVPTREEMEEVELSARLYAEGAAQFMIAPIAAGLDSDDPIKTPLTFILVGERLITVRYVQPRPVTAFVTRACEGRAEPLNTPEAVMLGLVEALIHRYADSLERTGAEIDGISRAVFKRGGKPSQTQELQGLIEQIGRQGELLAMVRESLSGLQRVLAYHAALDTGAGGASKLTRQKLRLLQRDAAALGELTDSMSGKIEFLLDATLGLINLEQNQIIKLFSVAAVALLPPTLIASVYGMNFEFMPELEWRLGYAWALGLMFLSAALPYLYFRRKGWL